MHVRCLFGQYKSCMFDAYLDNIKHNAFLHLDFRISYNGQRLTIMGQDGASCPTGGGGGVLPTGVGPDVPLDIIIN